MTLEKNIVKFIKERKIPLSVISRKTGIPYMALYNSLLNDDRDREIRGNELISVWELRNQNSPKNLVLPQQHCALN